MEFRADDEAGAAYLALSDRRVARTVEMTGDILVDLDCDGRAVGVELLNLASRQQIATAIGSLEPDKIPEDYLSGDLFHAFTMGYQMAVSDAESVALGEV